MRSLLTYVLALLLATWILLPLVVIGLYAFADPRQYYDIRYVVPTRFSLQAFDEVFFGLGAWRAVLNSLIVALLTVFLSLLLGVPAGYAFARFVFPGKDVLRSFIILTRIFPTIVIAIPLAEVYLRLGLADTLIGVALCHTVMALPFTILITYSTFVGVPRELEEAAMVFGCTRLGALLHITLPLALPGIAVAAIFSFIISWNEVFMASILTLVNRTLPAQIITMIAGGTAGAVPDPYKFVAGLIMAVPAMIFILIVRRYLVTAWGITLR